MGIILYQLAYGRLPFTNELQISSTLITKFPSQPRTSKQLKFLLYSMLEKKPSKRPKASQIVEYTSLDPEVFEAATNSSKAESIASES